MNRPHLSINLAISADGKISSVARCPSGWTSGQDHRRLQQLRRPADALIVSRGTLDADRMTLRAPGNPLRCVVSRAGRFDPGHPLFHSEGGPILLLGTRSAPDPLPGTRGYHMELSLFLRSLHEEHGVRHLHCEGGGGLIRELAELDAIDEIHLTWAGHRLFGGTDAPTPTGTPGSFLPSSRTFALTRFEPADEAGECFLSYRRSRETQCPSDSSSG